MISVMAITTSLAGKVISRSSLLYSSVTVFKHFSFFSCFCKLFLNSVAFFSSMNLSPGDSNLRLLVGCESLACGLCASIPTLVSPTLSRVFFLAGDLEAALFSEDEENLSRFCTGVLRRLTMFRISLLWPSGIPTRSFSVKVVANEDTMLRTQMFPRLPVRATFVADTKFVPETQNVSDFFQKHFVSATNVSRFAQHRNNGEQQCVCNIVSSFTTTLSRCFVIHQHILINHHPLL